MEISGYSDRRTSGALGLEERSAVKILKIIFHDVSMSRKACGGVQLRSYERALECKIVLGVVDEPEG